MSSATPFELPNGTELLMRSGNVPHYLYAAEVGGQSQSPGEGTSLSAGESTVTSIRTENWAKTAADHRNLENQRSEQIRQEFSRSNIDRLALLASVASDSMFGSGPASVRYTPNMSAYISGSRASSEALQTLHLMNPNFTGYGDTSNTSNMVLLDSDGGSGQGGPLGSSEQQHQHVSRFALASEANQSTYSHTSHMAAVANAELGNHNSPAELYTKRASNQGYGWGEGNEFSFLPSDHAGESNHDIHISLMKPGQLSAAEMSHLGVGRMTTSSYHEQAPLFANSIAAAGGHINGGHILSLSLSPQQPSVLPQLPTFPIQPNESTASYFHSLANAGSDSLTKEALSLPSKCAVGSSFTIPSCENMLGAGYEPQLHSSGNRQGDLFPGHLPIGDYGSKYLKPAQELLNEVVRVGQSLRGNNLKRSNLHSWTVGPLACGSDSSLIKNLNTVEASNNVTSWNGGKEAEPVGIATGSFAIPGSSENIRETIAELSTGEKQELQEKRVKLVGMRDEVDRRYKQYYRQMQDVATSFDSVAGLGAAAAYTALALQTISKNFRCLRDAITGQIQATCKSLGEEDIFGNLRGDTSKLRLIDQQLRQQRALRQIGMMQQQAWRPQRGLPEHSVSILRAWLFEHFLHPYPKDADKIMLAKQTGLNRNQVSNWFINARVRVWKPMVEEMYLEELKEVDGERSDKLQGINEDLGIERERANMAGESTSGEFGKPLKQAKCSGENCQVFGDADKGTSGYPSDVPQSRVLTGSTTDYAFLQEKGSTRQGSTDVRPTAQDVPCISGAHNKIVEGENKGSRPADSYKGSYGVAPPNGFIHADQLNVPGYGSYHLHGLGRYSQEDFGGGMGYAASGGVSLTLGLQRCEGINFSGGQKHYAAQGGTPHLLTSRQEDGVSSADYYNVNESGYEVMGLQNRKPFPAHMLCHDFVV